MIHIIDNFFSKEELPQVQAWANALETYDSWFELQKMGYGDDLVAAARLYFDLSSAIGCEMHRNDHTPFKHYDKDEELYAKEGKLSFPLCGIVYYPFINMQGGHLIFPDDEVAVGPKTNRAVFFRGNLLHDGVPFTGIRQSVGINPWSKKPLAYTS